MKKKKKKSIKFLALEEVCQSSLNRAVKYAKEHGISREEYCQRLIPLQHAPTDRS
jgi:hypothetical protein